MISFDGFQRQMRIKNEIINENTITISHINKHLKIFGSKIIFTFSQYMNTEFVY